MTCHVAVNNDWHNNSLININNIDISMANNNNTKSPNRIRFRLAPFTLDENGDGHQTAGRQSQNASTTLPITNARH
jgi:hypothetical protein